MKQGIHPKYYPNATVTCSCGNTWTVGSTVPHIHTDLCSNCHPFYTGEQRIVDTEGKVDRFYKKLEARTQYIAGVEARRAARTSPELPLAELSVPARALAALEKGGVTTAGQALEKMAQGDQALLSITGFGAKSLIDLKKRLRARGYALPGETEAEMEAAAEAVQA